MNFLYTLNIIIIISLFFLLNFHSFLVCIIIIIIDIIRICFNTFCFCSSDVVYMLPDTFIH